MLDKYRKVFINVLRLDENFDGTMVKRNETMNWDSLGHVSLISELEDSFGVFLDPEDIMALRSYEDGIKILEKYDILIKE